MYPDGFPASKATHNAPNNAHEAIERDIPLEEITPESRKSKSGANENLEMPSCSTHADWSETPMWVQRTARWLDEQARYMVRPSDPEVCRFDSGFSSNLSLWEEQIQFQFEPRSVDSESEIFFDDPLGLSLARFVVVLSTAYVALFTTISLYFRMCGF